LDEIKEITLTQHNFPHSALQLKKTVATCRRSQAEGRGSLSRKRWQRCNRRNAQSQG